MSGSIIKRKKGDTNYFYYPHFCRVKVNPKTKGQFRGSGKSKVITKSIYLGTAEDIVNKLKNAPESLSISQLDEESWFPRSSARLCPRI